MQQVSPDFKTSLEWFNLHINKIYTGILEASRVKVKGGRQASTSWPADTAVLG